jgi:hypothetical protein
VKNTKAANQRLVAHYALNDNLSLKRGSLEAPPCDWDNIDLIVQPKKMVGNP